MNQSKVNYILGFFILIGLYPKAYALPDDKYKAMHLTADSVELDQTTHKGYYVGHLTLDQGTTHLRAEEAETITDANNKLIKAIARGNKKTKAHIWTQTALDKPLLHAYADEIRYYPNQQYLELEGQASVDQGGNLFRAPFIRYDIKKQQVVTQKKGAEQTKIIIKNGKIQ